MPRVFLMQQRKLHSTGRRRVMAGTTIIHISSTEEGVRLGPRLSILGWIHGFGFCLPTTANREWTESRSLYLYSGNVCFSPSVAGGKSYEGLLHGKQIGELLYQHAFNPTLILNQKYRSSFIVFTITLLASKIRDFALCDVG